MRIDIVSTFPEMVEAVLDASIVGRARRAGHLQAAALNLREFTHDRHNTTDDEPFGGGAGMVMKPAPFFEAVAFLSQQCGGCAHRVIVTTPQGRPFTQQVAQELAGCPHLIMLCGHYEAIDERVSEHLATDEISVGDYVLTGGELPALVMTDAIARLLPDVLGNPDSLSDETFAEKLLGYPQYTRPAVYEDHPIPEVLQSGHHANIAKWRRLQRMERTRRYRPDLWAEFVPTAEDKKMLKKMGRNDLLEGK